MDFASRHIGPSPAEQQQMLAALGYASLDELTAAALPPGLAASAGLSGLPAAATEDEALGVLHQLAANTPTTAANPTKQRSRPNPNMDFGSSTKMSYLYHGRVSVAVKIK